MKCQGILKKQMERLLFCRIKKKSRAALANLRGMMYNKVSKFVYTERRIP